jgi:dihydropteroate synthase
MHMKGNPRDMTSHAEYKDLMGEILFYFSEKIAQGRALGVSDILVDPGFGFAKTIEQNYELLQQLEQFQLFGLPLLVGLSRKSMIYKLLETKAGNALNGSTALHMVALAKGARILRVHDVREAMECIKLQAALEKKY